jgi:hypothetical protein
MDLPTTRGRPMTNADVRAILIITSMMTVVALGGLGCAWAGGMPDEENDQQMPSKAIVGFVKDSNGNVIPDAKVVATFKTGNTDLITRSDATGHFRIPGFSKDATTDSVEVSCSKGGYKQTASPKRRSSVTSATAPIEIDCVLAHE